MKLAFFTVSAGIVVLSVIPGYNGVIPDKWGHFLGYGMCASLALFAWERRRSAMLAVALVAALGVLLELAHRYIPGRTVEPWDVLANLMGIGAGLLLGMNLRLMLAPTKTASGD
jgi:VanZ family protein